jgi:hypothetical protein
VTAIHVTDPAPGPADDMPAWLECAGCGSGVPPFTLRCPAGRAGEDTDHALV